ncbi:hypothetical protein KQI84_14975 [bacterium]|nr:hypothetical protein [bacterium]
MNDLPHPEDSSQQRFNENFANQPPPPPADDAQRQWEQMVNNPPPPPTNEPQATPPPPAGASGGSGQSFPFAPTGGAAPKPPKPVGFSQGGAPPGPGAGPCVPVAHQPPPSPQGGQGVYGSAHSAGPPSSITDFGARSGIPGEDFFSQDEADIRRAQSRPVSPLVIVIAVVVALLIISVAGFTLLKMTQPVPWEPSPIAEGFAPQSPTDFKLAVYTIILMQMVEHGMQPYIYMGSLQDDMPQSLAGMVDRGIIESRCAYDGWGHEMRLDPAEQMISSPGKNGKWGDEDDLIRPMFSEPDVPETYWADEDSFERRTQENHMSSIVQMFQAQNEISRVGLMKADQIQEDFERQRGDSWSSGGYDEDAVWGGE